MIEHSLKKVWEQLQGKKRHLPHFLSEIRLDGIRGLHDLRVVFDYPVSVIAGSNATGKSTVLFAAACAYKVPEAGSRDFVPSTLFPDYRPKTGNREDARPEVAIEFEYMTPNGRRSMRWRRTPGGWNRSYMGRKGADQPERRVYLRTLSNLSNPSEVRGVLSMSRLNSQPQETPLTASQIEFAHQVLPFDYSEVINLSSGKKSLLFAALKGGTEYSELHMAAGERSILRLSQEIAQLKGALVLIDEVEAGLHPYLQQLLMLQMQRLSLRNDLQIIVTSHSPVVLDSVPAPGRIFLERDDNGQVRVGRAYRDIVQDALYGRSHETLNVLCEDETAEGILQGILDFIVPKLRIRRESVRIGRNTGAEEFPAHATAFRKFGQIHHFVFVLDGDKHNGIREKIKASAESDVSVLFLPGEAAPELWVWAKLRDFEDSVAELGIAKEDLISEMNQLDMMYDSASDTDAEIVKSKMRSLAEHLNRSGPDICRVVARLEAESDDSEIQPLVDSLKDVLEAWRAASL